jgi:hypothetical protein
MTMSTEGRTCTRCGEWKEAEYFTKHPQTRDGLNPQCRRCQKIRRAELNAADPERKYIRREQQQQYAARQKAKPREYEVTFPSFP